METALNANKPEHDLFTPLLNSILEAYRARIAQLEAELFIMNSRQRNDYFDGCITVVEVKTSYLSLADEHSFYRGGDEQTIERIQDQYDRACDQIIMRTAESEMDMRRQFELVELYKNVIATVLVLVGIKVEIVDTYLWVETLDYHAERELRHTRFRFSATKQAWGYPLLR